MAATGRSGLETILDNNIYDNNSKDISPSMHRTVVSSMIESNFNLVDDELVALTYSEGQTLAQKFDSIASLQSVTATLSTWSANSQRTVNHAAGAMPKGVFVTAICTAAQQGYSPGDRAALNPGAPTDSGLSVFFQNDNTAVAVISDSLRIVSRSNYSRFQMDTARWDIEFTFIF